ncbi:MAG: acyl-ACP--UDP-N-acetylglucosamine O-acyltransferase [Elusimicrobiota bacterium]
MSAVHPTAIIDPGAKIDPSVKIGPYAVIGEDVVIGAGTTIGAHAVIEFTHMGKDNRILPGAFVGGPPQDLKYAGERTRLVMGDKNLVRECVTLNRGTSATGETRIGSGCLFMAYSHVAHDCRVGDGVILVNSVPLAGHVEVGDGAILGGSSAVHQFVRIGRMAMISGGSMVGKDVPPFCTAQGDRAMLRGLNSLGLRRAGLKADVLRALKAAYKTLFFSGRTLDLTLPELQAPGNPKEVVELAAFIAASKRGITRPAAGAQQEDAEL